MNILLTILDCLKILFQAFRYGIVNIPIDNSDSAAIRAIGLLNPFFVINRKVPHGLRIRNFLESLGPMFIKFGQLLSTRTDAVSIEITSHLKDLTDQCNPFSTQLAKEIIEKSLKIKIDDVFEDFQDVPLAAASLAQVHKAKLKSTSENVVIKVLRPNIHKQVHRNVRVMKAGGFLVNLFYKESDRLKLKDVIHDYEKTIFKELDLKVEAANTTVTKKNFSDSDLLFIPKVFWDHTTVNVLTLEEIDGLACTDIQAMDKLGIDRKILAENGVKIFLDQVFRDNFFHADMHPGNIFVSKVNVSQPSYIAIDCAIVGSLSREDQYNLARMLQATLKQDYYKLSELFIGAGWVSSQTNKAELEQTLRATCEPIFEKPLSEIEFGNLLLYLFDSTRQFGLSVQPSLILLQKTLIHIEGMGREIYADLDFWGLAEPYLDQWIDKQFSPLKLKEFLDLKVEAANTTVTKKNFSDSDLLFIPKVFWDHTTVNVLTLEEIDGLACTDIQAMDKLGIDRKILAENGVKIFLDQVFRDNFFHADMHPGNIFVSKVNVSQPSYIAIDCAIVGSLSREDQYNLARMLQATLKQDYYKLSELFIGAGWVSSQTNKAELEQTLRATCEPIFEKPLSEIEFGNLLLYLFDSTRQFGLSVQPSLILLQKTLIHIEGMGREIYADLDFWGLAEPYLDQWIDKQFSPLKLKEFLENNHYEILDKASSLPGEIFDLLDNIKFLANDGKKNIDLIKSLEATIQNQRKWQNLTILTLIGIIMILIGTLSS